VICTTIAGELGGFLVSIVLFVCGLRFFLYGCEIYFEQGERARDLWPFVSSLCIGGAASILMVIGPRIL
jgi:hypothetical protein